METVQLGDHRVPVVPQRHARLKHKLSGTDLEAVFSREYGHETYRLLGVLIPAIPEQIPKWEWEGYVSVEAMENDEYDEDLDKSPTAAEIVEAFEKVLQVNGADRVGKLLGLVQTMQKMGEGQTTQSSDNGGSTAASPVTHGESGE